MSNYIFNQVRFHECLQETQEDILSKEELFGLPAKGLVGKKKIVSSLVEQQ
jgi:hypothetical protein